MATPKSRPTSGKPKSTKQRAAIAQALVEAEGFRSAQELHDALKDGGTSVGLATVYRTLQAMSGAGELDVVRREDGETLYRRCSTTNHHHHLVCRACGYSVEIDNDEVERWAVRAARKHGFKEISHDLEIFGLCRDCAGEVSDRA